MEPIRIIAREYKNVSYAIRQLTGISLDEPVEIIVQDYKAVRSTAMNAYLWGWKYKQLAVALEEAGYCITDDDGHEWMYTPDLLHEMFREYFLVKGEIRKKGKIRKLFWSTTQLTKSKVKGSAKPSFGEYTDSIDKFALTSWEITIPEPMSGIMKSYLDELK